MFCVFRGYLLFFFGSVWRPTLQNHRDLVRFGAIQCDLVQRGRRARGCGLDGEGLSDSWLCHVASLVEAVGGVFLAGAAFY